MGKKSTLARVIGIQKEKSGNYTFFRDN